MYCLSHFRAKTKQIDNFLDLKTAMSFNLASESQPICSGPVELDKNL